MLLRFGPCHRCVDLQVGGRVEMLVLALGQAQGFAAHFFGTCTVLGLPLLALLVIHTCEFGVALLEYSGGFDFVKFD